MYYLNKGIITLDEKTITLEWYEKLEKWNEIINNTSINKNDTFMNDTNTLKKIEILKLGFGTCQIGGPTKFGKKQIEWVIKKKDSLEAIKIAISKGINFTLIQPTYMDMGNLKNY